MNPFDRKLKSIDAAMREQFGPQLCESEIRLLDESLAVETYLQFAERMGLNSAKQALAHQLDWVAA